VGGNLGSPVREIGFFFKERISLPPQVVEMGDILRELLS
jgi:hypothetical protein